MVIKGANAGHFASQLRGTYTKIIPKPSVNRFFSSNAGLQILQDSISELKEPLPFGAEENQSSELHVATGKQLYGSSASTVHRNLENRLIVPARSGIRRRARNSGCARAYWSSRRENFSATGPARTRIAATYEVIPRNKFRKSTATPGRELRNFPARISFEHTRQKGPSLPLALNEIAEISKNSANAT